MAAGAAIAVVGWWTGYKLGGVVALFTAEYFEKLGIIDYWQLTFLVLGSIIILMNIGLMFVNEPIKNDRYAQKKQTDKIIIKKLGSNNLFSKFFAYIIGTIIGPSNKFL